MFDNDVMVLKSCVACGSNKLKLTLDLNKQPLANSYRKDKSEVLPEFPLAINRCEDCYHVQLTHAVNPELMFKEYLYVSGTSDTMREYFEWFARYATEYFLLTTGYEKPKSVMDIGCNDGSQLTQFSALGLNTYGIDPAANLHPISCGAGHLVDLAFLNPEYALLNDETYDIITAQNVFAHNYDPYTFMLCVRKMMKHNSLFFVQTSQADMILNNEFDTIYHEHISFYNINSMNELCKRARMNLIDVVKVPLHGNSYVFVIARAEFISRPANIENLINAERRAGLLSPETYDRYSIRCENSVLELRNTVDVYRDKGYKIVGYGAAAKGMTVLNYSKIVLDYVIDDNELKQGRYTPGSSFPIYSNDVLKSEIKKILFVPLAWNFFDEIKRRIKSVRDLSDDRFCTYFPSVKVSS